jgi:DNA-binding transcriptional MerR regulator
MMPEAIDRAAGVFRATRGGAAPARTSAAIRRRAPTLPPIEALTIDKLAQRTGMTVRNVRAHQSRGLLPPPEVRGRTGYYGPEHVARIELIRELQDDGFSLELIGRLLTSAGSSAAAMRFVRAMRAPYGEEEPVVITAAELTQRWGAHDPKLLDRALELGIMRPLGDGRFEEVSPRLARVSAELAELGVTARQALEVAGSLRRHADSVARAYMKLFIEAVWKPFEAAGRPEESWPEVSAALERLRPLAVESLVAVFGLAMDDATERTFGRQLERLPRR